MESFYIPEEILRIVEKPGRYTGGELNSVVKDPAQVDVRMALCFAALSTVGKPG